MKPLTLYSYYRSSCSYRARIGLYLKKIPFEAKAVHLVRSGGEQFLPEFQKMNPFSQVPCLKHGDKVLSQSLPILLYLDELWPDPPLLPRAAFQKMEILSFCEMINSGIQPLQNLSVLRHVEESSLDKSQWAKKWIELGLSHCESFLKSRAGDFCFGDSLSMADLFLVPQIYSAKRFKADMSSFPVLARANANCLKLEAFIKALPENQPDAPK